MDSKKKHQSRRTRLVEASTCNETLLKSARPIMDALHDDIAGIGWCASLHDARGKILISRCDASSAKGVRESQGWPRIGEEEALGAPIFGPQGKMAALLGVTVRRSGASEPLLKLLGSLVGEAASRIEANLFQRAYANHRILRGPQDGPEGVVLLAINADDLVVGATKRARQIYHLADGALMNPPPTTDVLGEAQKVSLESAERTALKGALARWGGNAAAAARELNISRTTLYRRMKKLGVKRSLS